MHRYGPQLDPVARILMRVRRAPRRTGKFFLDMAIIPLRDGNRHEGLIVVARKRPRRLGRLRPIVAESGLSASGAWYRKQT